MDRLTLFSSEVFVFRPENTSVMNAALKDAILADRAQNPRGVKASVEGGWHSRPDLAQRPAPVFQALMQLIVDHVGFCVDGMASERKLTVPPHHWSLQSWAAVLDSGGFNLPHDHATSHWSIAWYVDPGEDGGAIAFLDPRRASPVIPGLDLQPSTFTVRPEAGMLLVFPGYLQHYTHPYRGSRPRICVSANLRMDITPQPG